MDYSEKHLDIGGSDMIYITFGNGKRPLVLIAGVSLTGISGLGESVSAAYSPLCETHTVYLFDRISPLPDGYSTENMAEDIAKAMNMLGISGADVMGASQGGMIGQLLAAYHPELVRSLIISSSMCSLSETAEKVIREWISLAEQENVRELNRSFFRYVYPEKFVLENKTVFDSIENIGTPDDCRRMTILAKAVLSFDPSEALPLIKCPVLVTGDHSDRVLSPEASEEIAKKLGCEIYMYDGYGHAVYDLAPDFKERMLDFYKTH